ncbi:MAG: polysaccharide lyase family 1 protein [Prevotella sp.]
MKNFTKAFLAMMLMMVAAVANAQTWNFGSLTDADKANLNADTQNWTWDSSNNRWKNVNVHNNEALKANGQELEFCKGLLLTVSASDRIRIDQKKSSLTLNGADGVITIPNLKAGDVVTVECQSSSNSTERGLTPTNLTITEGFTKSTSKTTNVGTVVADGDVTLTSDGGIYVYSIKAGESGGSETGGSTPAADHSTKADLTQNQARLQTLGNELKFYNTSDLSSIDIDKDAGTVTVSPKTGEWSDVYTNSVSNISFAKAQTMEGGEGDITNNGVVITRAGGWLETAFAEWELTAEATSYNVYIKGGSYTDYTKVDNELVRKYPDMGRVDVPGLKAGSGYSLKIVPVVNDAEQTAQASIADNIDVEAYDRSGFAHLNYSGIGAYNDDGTLKSDARVIYVSATTAKTVTLDVTTSEKGATTTYKGLQDILDGYLKGYETRPLCVRLVGTVTAESMDSFSSSAEGLQIKNNKSGALNITIEGIGNDAAVWGFGFLLRNAVSVELRNFAIMWCMDDAVSLDTDNKHCWIHHLDLFYGKPGSDSDQAKGDGTIDVKGDSQYITIAYNHLFDSGKASLCGMTSESGPNYIDYHHNWFDHSDSRHPRVRTMSVHVWNNYYDGCSKYGVGATKGSSVFVERNYFRATKNPMLISKQGTDAQGSGTFSGEDGGVIKSFGNVYAEKKTSGNYTPITHNDNATSFDCYEAETRDEQVPSSVTALSGSTAYDNFDTSSSLMYNYSPLEATDVPAYVTGRIGAGRMDKGDFKWTFTDADDTDYSVSTSLQTAVKNYTSKLVGWF